ncbi:hypothetical protein [Blastococcus haudaquaticus]|uniref:Uncharacterized protein n=1 Tax=Blastococcus haudaquaticus TaxID=1938745 RepID=A0A286GKU3_9ACTN|nr:hypothetical protein [Blastococcus haudaquaticus]SOD95594.1 hypothetical protein SAMN06272739_1266 [Blastococcus haudaquaticus]
MDLRQAAPWARAAGATGMAANALLVGFYALEAGRRPRRISLGSANDLVGSLGTALMLPVAVAVSPDRWTRRLGLISMTVLTIAGPALVAGFVTFRRQLPVALAGFAGLSGWVVLTSRAHRGVLPGPVTRLGFRSGGAVLAGGCTAAAGMLFPAGSTGRQVALAAAGVSGSTGMLALPLWFLRLGAAAAEVTPATERQPETGRR